MDIACDSAKTTSLDGKAAAPSVTRPGPSATPLPVPAVACASPARVKERGYRLAAFLWAADLLVACLAIAAGLGLRAWQRGSGPEFLTDLQDWGSPPIMWILAGAGLYSSLMLGCKAYEVGNLYRMHVWAMNAIKSLVLWLIVTLAILGLLRPMDFAPRAGLFYSVAALGGSQMIWRLIAYVFLMQPRVRESASHRIIIIGWNAKAAQLRQALRHDAAQLSEIIGCVPSPHGQFALRPPGDLAVLGDYGELARVVREFEATAVILADISCSPRELESLIGLCQREMLDFQMVPAFFPALATGLQVRLVSGVPLLGVGRLPLDRLVNRIIKRGIDVVGALVGLVVSLPIMAVFATLVYLESPGPVFFRQSRTSRSGRSFSIYKIRSMRPDAEAATGAVWARADDPRQLKIGALMRRWDIDELPAILERAARRHEPGRSAAGTAGADRAIQGGDSELQCTARDPRGPDRLGADPRLPGRHRPAQARGVRSLLPGKLESGSRRVLRRGDVVSPALDAVNRKFFPLNLRNHV